MNQADAFEFEPSMHVPFRDREVIARCRAIKRSEIEQHANPDFRIRVVADSDLRLMWITDMYSRIKLAGENGQKIVMLMPNPCPDYRHLARLINASKLDCKHVTWFALDEYADQDGRIAPTTWERGFGYAMQRFLWAAIDEDLRPPLEQVHSPSNENIDCYGDLMADAGGVDISYTGPGWTGHAAFIEPDAPEFAGSLEEWKQMGARVCTLSPLTLAQNSLHGSMGLSGDLSAVPPKAATVGPKEIIAAKHRWEMAGISIQGTVSSWQRLSARLCYHGPVTPLLPTSILQTLRTDVYITETIASDITDTWDKGY